MLYCFAVVLNMSTAIMCPGTMIKQQHDCNFDIALLQQYIKNLINSE